MSSALISKAIPLPEIAVAAADVPANYGLVGTFNLPLEIFTYVSTLDENALISFDGSTNHLVSATEGGFPITVVLNMKSNNMVLAAPVNIFLKYESDAPSTGSIYFAGFSATIP